MNGVHDMGGMDGFGAIQVETNEPVFHADWERKTFATMMALGRRLGNIDQFRHAIERIPAPTYLNSSYYERWLNAMMTLLVEKGFVTREELATSGADPIAAAQPANCLNLERARPSRSRKRARFAEGDLVLARNINPSGHTRLPRYVRGKRGVIRRDWGVYVLADSNAHHAGDHSQHVYSVAFEARELWGKDAPRRDKLHIDLWEDYLEADAAGEKRAAKKSTPSVRSKRGKK